MALSTLIPQSTTPHNDICVGGTCKEDGSNDVYVVLTAVMAGLSMFGGISICILYIVFKDLRTPGRQLLFFLAFSDALLAFGNILGIVWFLYSDSSVINKSEGYCDFQSAMTIYFSITSFSWTVIMGLTLFATVVLNKQNFTSTYMKMFHIFAWIPGAIITIVAWSLDVLGTDTTLDQASWCWIDPRVPHALLWQFATGKFFEICCYIVTVVLYTSIKIFLARQSNKMIGKSKKKSKKDVIAEANRKLTFVPLVFIVCRIWGTLRFLIGNFGEDIRDEPYVTWINPLQGIGDSAQGFANFVIYCFSTESIRQRMFPCFQNKIGAAELSGFDSKTKFTGKSSVAPTEQPSCSGFHDDIKTAGKDDVNFAETETPIFEGGGGNPYKAGKENVTVNIDTTPIVSTHIENFGNENETTITIVEKIDLRETNMINSGDTMSVVNETEEEFKRTDSALGTGPPMVGGSKVENDNNKAQNKTEHSKTFDGNNGEDKNTTKHENVKENKFAENKNTGKSEDDKAEVSRCNIEGFEIRAIVVDTRETEENGSSDSVADEPVVTMDTGGVYLGTVETDPTKMNEFIVTVTPPDNTGNDIVSTESLKGQNTDLSAESRDDSKTTNISTDKSRSLSVTVDMLNKSTQGLVEISN